MSSNWHYAKDGARLGPVPSERLRELAVAGELVPTDLIWKEGMAEWRPASSLKGLFPESKEKPTGPPPLPPAKPDDHFSPLLPAAELDAQSVVPSSAAEPTNSPPPRKPDFFDKARALAQKAQAKAEAFQKEAQAKAERMREEAHANPNATQEAIRRGAKAAVDYARSDEAKELARKTRDTVKGGALAATALAGAASAEGRERVRKAAEHSLGVGAALLFFFPLGLYLVWHHPLWPQSRKWAWTGAWLGVFILMMVPAMMAPRNMPAGYGVVSHGIQPTFEDHPPPVTESVSNGAEVWLLDDCNPHSLKSSAGHRYAFYVVLSGDNLAYALEKQYFPPGGLAQAVLETKEGGTEWIKYPAGESKSGSLVYTWAGRKHKGGDLDNGADEAMVLKSLLDFKSTDISQSGSHAELSSGAFISLRRYGEEIRWEFQASSSASLIGGKRGKLPPNVNSREGSGSGRRLRSE